MESSDTDKNVAVLVVKIGAWERLSHTWFHEEGIVHDHSATQLLPDLKLLGYNEVILQCDGEPALKGVQEEVKRSFEGTASCEHSSVGDSGPHGAADRTVQSVGEMYRVFGRGLQDRVDASLHGKHAVTAWLVSMWVTGFLVTQWETMDASDMSGTKVSHTHSSTLFKNQ